MKFLASRYILIAVSCTIAIAAAVAIAYAGTPHGVDVQAAAQPLMSIPF